jgi:hypothetical protein
MDVYTLLKIKREARPLLPISEEDWPKHDGMGIAVIMS